MSKEFKKKIIKLIEQAKVSCAEATAEDSPYELAPLLWEAVCDEFGYWDWDTESVVKE